MAYATFVARVFSAFFHEVLYLGHVNMGNHSDGTLVVGSEKRLQCNDDLTYANCGRPRFGMVRCEGEAYIFPYFKTPRLRQQLDIGCLERILFRQQEPAMVPATFVLRIRWATHREVNLKHILLVWYENLVFRITRLLDDLQLPHDYLRVLRLLWFADGHLMVWGLDVGILIPSP